MRAFAIACVVVAVLVVAAHAAEVQPEGRFRFALVKRARANARTSLEVQDDQPDRSSTVITVPDVPGYTRTGAAFWVKAFIPGKNNAAPSAAGLKAGTLCHTVPSAYTATGSWCSENFASSDPYVRSAPKIPFMDQEYYRVDNHCFSTDPNASHRLGARCEIFKNSGNFKVRCVGKAGTTRHFIKSGNCWKLKCQKRDSFRLDQTFTVSKNSDTSFTLDISGSNPCVSFAPRAVFKATFQVRIGGGQFHVKKITGAASRFPCFVGFFKDNGGSVKNILGFNMADRSEMSLALPNISINMSPGNSPYACSACT